MMVRHMISGVLYKGTMEKMYPESDFISVAQKKLLKKKYLSDVRQNVNFDCYRHH